MALTLNTEGVFYIMIDSLTQYVFGHVYITSTFILLMLLIVLLISRVPTPISFAVNIPLSVVMIAYGLLPLVFGGMLAVGFLVVAVLSLIGTMGIGT